MDKADGHFLVTSVPESAAPGPFHAGDHFESSGKIALVADNLPPFRVSFVYHESEQNLGDSKGDWVPRSMFSDSSAAEKGGAKVQNVEIPINYSGKAVPFDVRPSWYGVTLCERD